MYTIYCDGELLYSPTVTDNYPVSDAVLKQELNRADSLTFKMYQNHPLYGSIDLMKSTLVVFDGDEPISILRPIARERDFYNNLKFTCEGCLAFFNDSIVPEYHYKTGGITVEDYFDFLMSVHSGKVNVRPAQVDEDRRPTSWVSDPGTYFDDNNLIVRENTSYPETWTEMCDKLLNLLGGYFIPKYTSSANNGATFRLEYRVNSGGNGSQVIQFNRNLIDFSEVIDRTDRYSRLIPLGAKPEGSESFLTIKSVNSGLLYLEDADAVNLYGKITKTHVWEDVTQAANLKTKGQAELDNHVSKFPVSMTVNAADLSYLGVDDRFRIGQINQVISEPHGINEPFRCAALQIVFDNLAKNVYTFGEVKGTLTRMI